MKYDLSVNLIKATPAQVEFDSSNLKNMLEEVLNNKYAGLVVTKDDVVNAKKILADVRKGQKNLDTFRKNTKKMLSAPIKDFEAQCKELDDLFVKVIEPLDSQIKDFESQERDIKLHEVEILAEEVEQIFNCTEHLEIKKEYLNKSMSLKKIKDDLESQAKLLKEKEKNNLVYKQLINKTCTELGLQASNYYKLLDYEEINNILDIIENDAKEAVVEEKSNDIFSAFNNPKTPHTINLVCTDEDYNDIMNYILTKNVEVK